MTTLAHQVKAPVPPRCVTFHVAGASLSIEVAGESRFGGQEVLLDGDDDLTAAASWASAGYSVEPFVGLALHEELADWTLSLLRAFLRQAGVSGLDAFRLEDYHHFVDDRLHEAIVQWTMAGFPTYDFPVLVSRVTDRVSEICGASVVPVCPGPWPEGQGDLDPSRFFIRVVRPNTTTDCNPPHRDAWLDRLRNAINIYVPIAGSTPLSALPVVPGSHRWCESDLAHTIEGARVNGRRYTVPSVIVSRRELNFVRPNPGANEMLIFSPYIVHGGAVNLNPDTTRVSLEMRFWRVRPGSGSRPCP